MKLIRPNFIISTAVLVLFLLGSGSIGAVPESCTMPNCPEGCSMGAGSSPGSRLKNNIIERTFLKGKTRKSMSKSERRPKRFSEECINPLLDVIITDQDMAGLLGIGNITNRRTTDTGVVVNIDVGVEGEDTQYWHIPEMPFNNQGFSMESIDTGSTYWTSFLFPEANIAFKATRPAQGDTLFSFFDLNTDELLRLGKVEETETEAYALDWFSTSAFLPIECGWIIEETITTIYPFDHSFDSLVEVKLFTIQSTGMLTPLNEDPVEALLGFEDYTNTQYKNGNIVSYGEYEAFVWFSKKGHRITAFLEPGAPYEGVTQFNLITYDIIIPSCPPTQDIGVDPGPGTYAAQEIVKSGANLLTGPIQFVAGQSIELRNEFATSGELSLLIDTDPCNL